MWFYPGSDMGVISSSDFAPEPFVVGMDEIYRGMGWVAMVGVMVVVDHKPTRSCALSSSMIGRLSHLHSATYLGCNTPPRVDLTP